MSVHNDETPVVTNPVTTDSKMLCIVCAGLFTDAYNLFSISLLTRLIGRLYFQDSPDVVLGKVDPGRVPIGVDAAISSVALVGSLCGQLILSYIGDKLDKKLYGWALCIMIGAALCQSLSFGTSANAVVVTLCFWRFILGLGVGGAYPPSSALMMSEYSTGSSVSRRAYVGAVLAMQGLGMIAAAATTAIVAAIFDSAYSSVPYPWNGPGDPYGLNKANQCTWTQTTADTFTVSGGACTLDQKNEYKELLAASCPREHDIVWRIVLAAGCIPALVTLYFRHDIADTHHIPVNVDNETACVKSDLELVEKRLGHGEPQAEPDPVQVDSVSSSKLPLSEKYWKVLLGAAMSWCLLNMAFYSQNLFQKDVFLQLGFLSPGKFVSAIEETAQISKFQMLVALGSTVLGYWVTAYLGRKPIQFVALVFMTALMAVLAGSYWCGLSPNTEATKGSTYQSVKTNGWIGMYALTFTILSANSTAFIIPAELHHCADWRSTGQGVCVAMGKLGAIIGAIAFLYAAQPYQGEISLDYPCAGQYQQLLCNAGAGTGYSSSLISGSNGNKCNYQGPSKTAGFGGRTPGVDLSSAAAPILWGDCQTVSNCPSGRTNGPAKSGAPSGHSDSHEWNACDYCVPDVLSGCFPFGIGLDGALGILAAISLLGMLFTLLVPETMGETLEDLIKDDTKPDTTGESTRINTADDHVTCSSAAAADKLGPACKAVVDIELTK